MSMPISRRRFVQGIAAGACALGLGRSAFAQPSSSLRIRKSALELPPTDQVFHQYADAVTAMHALPQNDPRRWLLQARIHADHCQHGTAGFLPWHRHYLNQFEQICGELINDHTFALPYWDWTDKAGKLPDPFFDVAALNVTHWNDDGQYNGAAWGPINTTNIRAISKGFGVQNDPTNGGAFTAQKIQSILQETDFDIFEGRLEGEPHNTGHIVVGQPANGQAGHMASGLSPLDPIFWLHHCNVDRLWAQWQLAGNTTPPIQGNYNGDFVDATGHPVNVTAAGALDFHALGYSYEQFENPRNLLDMAGLASATSHASLLASFTSREHINNNPVTIGSVAQPTKVNVGVAKTVPIQVSDLAAQLKGDRTTLGTSLPSVATQKAQGLKADMLVDFGRAKQIPRQILARFRNVKGNFERPPVVGVYVNCPYLAPQTPWSDPHYAGTFTFFGSHAHDHDAGHNFVVDLTGALRNIDLRHANDLRVQFMARGAAASFEVGQIEIISA